MVRPSQPIQSLKAHEVLSFDTQDSLFDLAWAETHENQCLVAAGDGSIKLFDIGLDEFPIQSWKEHNREVFAVHWNLVAKDTFCSSSWDGTIKVVRTSISLYISITHPSLQKPCLHNPQLNM